jgi:hypothetical protein
MKAMLLYLVSAFFAFGAAAQSPFNNETNTALEKVIRDYPFHFQHIKDRVLNKKGTTTEFASKITIPEARACMVIERQNSPNLSTTIWQADMYQSDDFTSAGNTFKQLFEQIKNTIVKLDNEKPIILNGNYEAPSEKNTPHSIIFDLLPTTSRTQYLKVDLSLAQSAGKWKIVLSVYEGDKIGKEQAYLVSSNDY